MLGSRAAFHQNSVLRPFSPARPCRYNFPRPSLVSLFPAELSDALPEMPLKSYVAGPRSGDSALRSPGRDFNKAFLGGAAASGPRRGTASAALVLLLGRASRGRPLLLSCDLTRDLFLAFRILINRKWYGVSLSGFLFRLMRIYFHIYRLTPT